MKLFMCEHGSGGKKSEENLSRFALEKLFVLTHDELVLLHG